MSLETINFQFSVPKNGWSVVRDEFVDMPDELQSKDPIGKKWLFRYLMNEYPDMKFFNCTTIDDVLKVDIENFGEVVK